MKKITVYILAIAMACSIPSYSESLDATIDEYDQAVGICAADGMSTGVGVSMMGWGLAIIVGIAILAIVLHQSTSTTHSSSSSNSSTNTGGTGSPGNSSTFGSII
jgi:hypothetical protein